MSGRRVLVVEDTSTTGGSPLDGDRSLPGVRAQVVAGAAVIADRSSGAGERIRSEAGVDYRYAYGPPDHPSWTISLNFL